MLLKCKELKKFSKGNNFQLWSQRANSVSIVWAHFGEMGSTQGGNVARKDEDHMPQEGKPNGSRNACLGNTCLRNACLGEPGPKAKQIIGLKTRRWASLNKKLPKPRRFLHPVPSGYHRVRPPERVVLWRFLSQICQTLSGHAISFFDILQYSTC